MTWLLVFFGFSLLIVLHEAGHFFAAKAMGMKVERAFLFFGPTIWSIERGGTEYGIKAIPLGGFVKIAGLNPEEELSPEIAPYAYYRQPVWRRIVAIGAGPAVNVVFAFLILFSVYLVNAQEPTQRIGDIRSQTPAAEVLRPGDQIVAVDGRSFPNLDREARMERFIEQIGTHECAGKPVEGCRAATPVELRIRRGGEVQTVSVRPEYKAEFKRTLIGFSYASVPANISAGEAASGALDSIWLVTSKTATIFSRIFESEQRKEISGIVGISDVAHQTIEQDTERSLLLLALVSLSLGLINLVPILPLDGGHIFWAVVEKLRGRPVSMRVMERAAVVGFAVVALLFFIGLSNDLGRLGGDGTAVR